MNCIKCNCEYVYPDGDMFVCPECAYEWHKNQANIDENDFIVKDCNGSTLEAGDKVTLSKSLKVKGSSLVLKIGTKARIKQLVDGDHNIDCKVDGQGDMMLKSEFVKKA